MKFFYFFFLVFTVAYSAQSSLDRLVAGNKRFCTDKSEHPDRTSERRLETAGAQTPFAIIVGCSDSRVAPEIIFDQGIGDLFIVRVAGNVVGPLELDSIDFAALYLKSSVILVLGHENCGAVKAVMQGTTKDIESVAKLIAPAVKPTLEESIKANVQLVVKQLQDSAVIKKLKTPVVGGYYNFHTGEVELIK